MKVFACALIACLAVYVYAKTTQAPGNSTVAGQGFMSQADFAKKEGASNGLGSIAPLAALTGNSGKPFIILFINC